MVAPVNRLNWEAQKTPPRLPEQEPGRDNRWWVLAVVGAFVAGLLMGR